MTIRNRITYTTAGTDSDGRPIRAEGETSADARRKMSHEAARRCVVKMTGDRTAEVIRIEAMSVQP